MTKVAEAIVVITLLIFSFFIGVKYSDSVKGHAGWLFETKEEEVELPDLTNENGAAIGVIDENGVQTEAANPSENPATNDFAPDEINQDTNSGKALQP